jgi:hypothetical protein
VNIDTSLTEGAIKIIIRNKASNPETTETFDPIQNYQELWTAINHGLAGVNSGNPSHLVRIDWVGYILPPPCADSGMHNGADSVHSSVTVRDPNEQLTWTHHRAGFFIAEREYNRMFTYGIYNPKFGDYYGGELVRYRMDNISNVWPSITKTIMTKNSGDGITQQTVVPEVAYKSLLNRNRWTSNFKEILTSRGRSVIWQPDKYVIRASGANDLRVVTAQIDSNNSVESFVARNRVTEDCYGLKNTKISFRPGYTIAANRKSPARTSILVVSGRATAGLPPDSTYQTYWPSGGKNFEGFEDYTSYSRMDSLSGAFTVTGADSAKTKTRVYDSQDQTSYAIQNPGLYTAPEYAWRRRIGWL